MVEIYTFCDKTLIGRRENLSSKFLCQNLYKMNFKIESVNIKPTNYDFESINFKNKNIYFLLMEKCSSVLNSCLAGLSGCELSENLELKKEVIKYYSELNLPVDSDASLEWVIPQKARPITNPNGKTQGYSIKMGETEIFVLPNEFLQLKKIFDDCLMDYLENNYSINYVSETYKTFGISEENLKKILEHDIKNKDRVSVSIFSKGLENDVVIKAKKTNEFFEKYRRDVFSKLEKYIYSVQDMGLEEYLNKLIIEKNVKIAFCGDQTIAKVMSIINKSCYENNIKQGIVASQKEVLIKFAKNKDIANSVGVASSEMSYELAVKLLEDTNAELCVVSLSEKNEGLTTSYIAIGNKNKIDIYKNQFNGTEEDVLNNLSKSIIFYLIKKILLNDYKIL